MMANGFSWPSTILVCNAEYTSLKLIEAGAASKALNIEVQSGETGTRIFKPLKSSGPLIGLLDDVVSRNPLSQILSITTRLALVISLRIKAPSSPSIAFQTVSLLGNAKPMALLGAP